MRILLLAAALAAAVFAQESAKTTGSISGVVKDATTGTPLPEVTVFAGTNMSGTTSKTDASGRYTLRDLKAGTYRVNVMAFTIGRPFLTKTVTLGAGQELTSIDFPLQTFGEISGKILDENKEPVPGRNVMLVAREYRLGVLEHVYAGAARTDDQGAYRLQRVTPGRAFLIVVQRPHGKLSAVSDAPADPKLRKKVFPPTYYPGSTSIDGAQPLILRSGERREGVDMQLSRVPSFCIEGVLATESGPAALDFQVAPRRPASGRVGDGAIYIAVPIGQTGPDGKLRLCELPPADYELTVYQRATAQREPPPFFSIAQASIADRDVRNFQVQVRPRVQIPGEVVWDGAPPDKPLDAKLSIRLEPSTRGQFMGEDLGAKSSIPGEFNFSGVFVDEYAVLLHGLPKDLYTKDITYAGTSVLRAPLRVGSAIGEAKLRIVLARDGAVINGRVADKDGNPVPDSYVLIFPAEATTEAELAAALISGQTDQKGVHTTKALAPGKYLVLASTTPVDMSPESIGKLYQARTRAQEITLAPNATVAVTLTPANLQ